jgi:outer membrane receptor protein involved in Fe transport
MVILALGLNLISLGAADPSPAVASNPTNSTGTITIVGERPAVEQGEKSLFTALPPRDLLLRPLVESPGLETATTVVGRPEIERFNAYTALDALRYTPGAWTETRGRKEKMLFSVRGQRYPYPGHLVDGAWFREFTESAFFLNAAFLEQIELTRSSADLLLSPGGMAGHLHLVPRQYPRPETQVQAEYGTLNTVLTRLTHGAPFSQGMYGLGVSYRHTDGPENMNARENVGDLYGRLQWQATPRLQLSLFGYALNGDRQLQLARPPAMLSLQNRRESADPMNYQMLVARARLEWERPAVTEATFNFGNRRYLAHQTGTPDWLEKDLEYGARLLQTFQLSERNHLRVSGLFNHWETPTGKRFYAGRPGDLSTYAAALTDEHQWERLTLNAGYRFSQTYIKEFGGFHVEGSTAGLTAVQVRNEWEDPLHTLSLGAKYTLSPVWSLHANFTWGQIASQPGMLNAALQRPDTETRWKYDLGVRAAWPSYGEISLTAFLVDQYDAPLIKNTAVTVNGLPFALFENTDARSYGVEFETRTRRFDFGLQLFFNATLMTTERRTPAGWRHDPELPEVVLGGGASYLYRRLEAIFLAKHVGLYENDRFLPAGMRPVDLGDFVELSASLNCYLGREKQHRLYLAVENLTDEEYSTVVGYPHYGLMLKGGLTLVF